MKVLVTGAGGFLGRNLLAGLETLPLSRRPQVLSCHRDTPPDLLSRWCREAEFVFHLAGVNRAPNPEAFWEGNFDFTKVLLACLAERPCPVLFASSVQAGSPTPYGQSKLAAEEVLLRYSAETRCGGFSVPPSSHFRQVEPPGLQQRRRYLLPPHGPGASGHHPESRAAAASGLRGRCGGGVAPLPGRFPQSPGQILPCF